MAGLNKAKRNDAATKTTPAAQIAAAAQEGGSAANAYASSHIGRDRKRITVDLDVGLHEQLLDAIWYAQHHGAPTTTKVGTIHRGIELALDELAAEHDVESWPPRRGSLRQGGTIHS